MTTTGPRVVERRPKVAAFATFVAVSAYGGAIGLATGALDMGHTLNQRLPFHSPVLAALALSIIVGVPSSLVAMLAAFGDQRTSIALIGAGGLLIGWIVVEIAFIRELAFLQVFYLGVGVVYVVIGRTRSPGVDVGPPLGGASGPGG